MIKPRIPTAPSNPRPHGTVSVRRYRKLVPVLLLGLLLAPFGPPWAMSSGDAGEEPEPRPESDPEAGPRTDSDPDPLPDPLEPPAEPTLSERDVYGGGSVPASMTAPSRTRVGNFVLGGQLSAGVAYDDNVEADDDDRDEDVLLTLSPSVRAQSVYARHRIGFGAGATAGTALKDNADDIFDWRVGADGRVDLSRKSKIDAAVDYSWEEEDDEDVDAEDDDGDTSIHNIGASLGYDVEGERLGFGVGGTVARLEYDGGDFGDRDNTSYGLRGAMRYRWSEDVTFSGGPRYRRSSFDDDVADDGLSRDANEYGVQIGAGYRATRTIDARAALGYARVDFDDSGRDDDDSATGSLGLTWAPGFGTTLSLGASRSLGLSVEDDEDSRTSTTGSAALVHRLKLGSRSTLSSLLSGNVNRLSDFDRTDKNLVTGLTFAYRLAEHAFFTSSYRFSLRDSDDGDADYYRNLLSVGVTLSY